MNTHDARPVLPFVPNPCAPYGAWRLGTSILVGDDDPRQPLSRFDNAFCTPISVVNWSHDGSILLAGSMTGEVLAWRVDTGERLLANRHAHSYAPIVGVSWSPGGYYLVALTMARTIQIWQVAARKCLLVLPCRGCTTTIKWFLDGSGFRTDDGISWIEPEGGH